MRIRFWGVRGSLPAPMSGEGLTAKLFEAVAGAHDRRIDLSDPDSVRAYLSSLPFHIGGVVGGNTTCIEIGAEDHTIVIDAGTGIRPLGLSLLGREFGRGTGTVHLFFTHAHWDHLMGFPFFQPAYVPGNRIICYAVNHHPFEYLQHLMTGPTFFPIDPDRIPAKLEFVTLREGEPVTIGPVTVNNIHLHHPGIAYAYRFDEGPSSFVLATDAEFKALDDEATKDHLKFFQGADVLAFDAQFSLNDAFTFEDWGHSSALIGVDLAIRAGVKRLVTIHHDPNHTDRQIWEVAEAAQAYARISPDGEGLEVSVGHEGLELFLSGLEDAEWAEAVKDGALILTLSGRLSAAAAQELRDRLRHRGARDWRHPLAIDLSQVQSSDPEGIAGLVMMAAEAGDGPLTIIAPAHHLRLALSRSLEAAGSPATVYEHHTSALAAIVGPAHLRLKGSLIAGRYRLTDLVTTDDEAALYLAHDVQMERRAIAHILNPSLTHRVRTRYLELFRAWGRLSHPAIQSVLDILPDENGLTVIVLEELAGQTLKDYWQRHGRLSPDQAVEVAGHLLEALAYLAGQGLPHGELRPEAIYWNGRVRIAITGLTSLHLRGSNAIWLGKGAYYAPERLAGQPASEAADLFSLGIILYQMLCGVHPFESETGEVTALRLASGTPPASLHTFNPTLSPALEQAVLRLLAHEPAARFASAGQAHQALRDAV